MIENPGEEQDSGVTVLGSTAQLRLDLRVHRLSAIKKTAYRLAKRFTAVFGSIADDHLTIDLELPPGAEPQVVHEAVKAFHRELLDQDLREEVAEETAPIRALLLAHAFSRTDLAGRT